LQIILLIILVLHPFSAPVADGRLHVAFLDVGQGDAALVIMPNGTTLLIDGGGRPSLGSRKPTVLEADGDQLFERDSRGVGEAVVSPYLWSLGLSQIDYVLATHADADHIDGLNDVARNFQVRAALIARSPGDDPEFVRFAATLAALRIPRQTLGAGDQFDFGGATATVLWPALSNDARARSGNNDSIVLRLQFGERKILMTGDIEKEAEAAILRSGADLTADVVKVPHHGSRTSSTAAFVSATHPQFAVISVGLTSIFGHPHKEVFERWRASGAEVMTTGSRGTITMTTDGHDLRVSTFVMK
jgi:competence protein ComEC